MDSVARLTLPIPVRPHAPQVAHSTVIALAIAGLLLLGACSNNKLLTKRDYAPSLRSFALDNVEGARREFPKGEEGTFITTLEKAYLDLLRGDADLTDLKRYRDLADERFRFVVSREIKAFFYVSTPEGYYASEHEIIWMHILLSWGYSQQRQFENACVEARQAAYLLQVPWSDVGHFDDPTLRIFLAGMFATCGAWNDAQVVLRGAADLDPMLTWARELADRESPPRNLFLMLGGVGPVPYWDPNLELNPLRGARHLGFRSQGQRSPLYFLSGGNRLPFKISPGSAPWYSRHLIRDNEIHDLIVDTNYALETSGEVALHAARTAEAVAVLIGASALGLAGGYAVAEICIHTNCGEGAGLIIVLPIAGITYGANKAAEIQAESKARLAERTDPSNFYRFVRFLPEYAWLGWSDDDVGDRTFLANNAQMPPNYIGVINAVTPGAKPPRVFIGHLADTPAPDSVPPPSPQPASAAPATPSPKPATN